MFLKAIPVKHLGHRLGHSITKRTSVANVVKIEDVLTYRVSSISNANKTADVRNIRLFKPRNILSEKLGLDIYIPTQRLLGFRMVIRIIIHVECPFVGHVLPQDVCSIS